MFANRQTPPGAALQRSWRRTAGTLRNLASASPAGQICSGIIVTAGKQRQNVLSALRCVRVGDPWADSRRQPVTGVTRVGAVGAPVLRPAWRLRHAACCRAVSGCA
jgi:hypothetical protein